MNEKQKAQIYDLMVEASKKQSEIKVIQEKIREIESTQDDNKKN